MIPQFKREPFFSKVGVFSKIKGLGFGDKTRQIQPCILGVPCPSSPTSELYPL